MFLSRNAGWVSAAQSLGVELTFGAAPTTGVRGSITNCNSHAAFGPVARPPITREPIYRNAGVAHASR